MQGGTNSSEFRIPDSELEGSVELRIPGPQPSRLTPVPSDKILFPRRMLYVEAVLYVTVAAAAFGLGYLSGRGSSPANGKEDAEVQMQVPVVGKVLLDPTTGAKGAVVIVLPAGKLPGKEKRLPIAGLRPDDPPSVGDATRVALAEFGGNVVRVDASGDFRFRVPAAGSYHILILLQQVGNDSAQRHISELEEYFDAPADLLKGCRCCWLTKDLRLDSGPIDVTFTE